MLEPEPAPPQLQPHAPLLSVCGQHLTRFFSPGSYHILWTSTTYLHPLGDPALRPASLPRGEGTPSPIYKRGRQAFSLFLLLRELHLPLQITKNSSPSCNPAQQRTSLNLTTPAPWFEAIHTFQTGVGACSSTNHDPEQIQLHRIPS